MKKNKIVPTSQPPVGIFIISICAILAACLWVQIQWQRTRGPVPFFGSAFPLFPSGTEMIQNFKLVFEGYGGGYLRTIQGISVFVLLSIFFLATGKIIFSFIFKEAPKGQSLPKNDKDGDAEISFLEKGSLYYILGSLFSSFLWLGLGSLGFLTSNVAWLVLIAGVILFFIQRVRSQYSARKTCQDFFSRFKASSFSEKVIASLLLFLLLSSSTDSVSWQTYSDSNQIHLVLPSIYINSGKISPNPYMIYSYFPQNTEMLVLWALLLKSEMATGLLMWGFTAAWVVLAWGVLDRWFGTLPALCSVVMCLSAPIVIWFSTVVKNDFPAALFLFAHYVTLAEALNGLPEEDGASKRWLLLSGLLCGGAVGHKLTALIPAMITFLLLAGTDVIKRRRTSLVWLSGLLCASFPWFLRDAWITGNPFYPYFHGLFRAPLVKPWHTVANVSTSIAQNGWPALWDYFKLLLGIARDAQGSSMPPNWGPQILFIPLVLACFRRKIGPGLRMVIGAALLSWMAHLGYSLDARYHTGFILVLVSLPFSIIFSMVLREVKYRKIFKILTIFTVASCSWISFSHSTVMKLLQQSCTQILSGYSPGNFNSDQSDDQLKDLRWMSHLINTRTAKTDSVLFAGVSYGSGMERKIFFGVDPDKQILQDLAENSSSASELHEKLRSLGADHILMSATFFEALKNSPRPDLKLRDQDYEKIKELIRTYMNLRYETLDGRMAWYSFKEVASQSPILLDVEDCLEYPQAFIDQCIAEYFPGKNPSACMAMEKAVRVPMYRTRKVLAYSILGSIYMTSGQKKRAETTELAAVNVAPELPDPYLNIAIFYGVIGEKEKARNFVLQAISHGGLNMVLSDPRLAPYVR